MGFSVCSSGLEPPSDVDGIQFKDANNTADEGEILFQDFSRVQFCFIRGNRREEASLRNPFPKPLRRPSDPETLWTGPRSRVAPASGVFRHVFRFSRAQALMTQTCLDKEGGPQTEAVCRVRGATDPLTDKKEQNHSEGTCTRVCPGSMLRICLLIKIYLLTIHLYLSWAFYEGKP